MSKTWSVIVCSIDASKYAHIVQSYERLLAGRQFEIIGIHDARSLAEAYSRAIDRAQGEVLVFSHDDILIVDDAFASKVEAHFDSGFDVLGFAGATDIRDAYWWSAGPDSMRGVIAHAPPAARQVSLHIYGVTEDTVAPVQVLDGLCLIAQRSAIDQLLQHGSAFDAQSFDGFHLYDLDFCYNAYLRGLRLGAMCDIPIMHMSTGNFGNDWRHYRQRFVAKYAEQLGIDPFKKLPELQTLRARVALFDDFISLQDFWQHAKLHRASLAMRRNPK